MTTCRDCRHYRRADPGYGLVHIPRCAAAREAAREGVVLVPSWEGICEGYFESKAPAQECGAPGRAITQSLNRSDG